MRPSMASTPSSSSPGIRLSVLGWGVDHAVMEVGPARLVVASADFLSPQCRVVAQRIGVDDQGQIAERETFAIAILRNRSRECGGKRRRIARAPSLVDVDV